MKKLIVFWFFVLLFNNANFLNAQYDTIPKTLYSKYKFSFVFGQQFFNIYNFNVDISSTTYPLFDNKLIILGLKYYFGYVDFDTTSGKTFNFLEWFDNHTLIGIELSTSFNNLGLLKDTKNKEYKYYDELIVTNFQEGFVTYLPVCKYLDVGLDYGVTFIKMSYNFYDRSESSGLPDLYFTEPVRNYMLSDLHFGYYFGIKLSFNIFNNMFKNKDYYDRVMNFELGYKYFKGIEESSVSDEGGKHVYFDNQNMQKNLFYFSMGVDFFNLLKKPE